ncbi:hypothetical protein H4Q26_007718 [Puccinia striiformis f. sp. tritici PST-130]|nr:hypothetical protein H4Q26_007718 [Puccinia striiformis f. sp. tritici PST-130]
MEPFATMDLESLRAAANHYAVRRRMTHHIRDEVDDLYYNFECSLVRLAIQYRINPIFSLIIWAILTESTAGRPGITSRNTIGSAYAHDTLDREEARDQVGALWDTKPDEEKKRRCALHPPPNPIGDARLNGPVQASRVTYEKTEKMVNDWVHRVKIDLHRWHSTIRSKGSLCLPCCIQRAQSLNKEDLLDSPNLPPGLGRSASQDQESGQTQALFQTHSEKQSIHSSCPNASVSNASRRRVAAPNNSNSATDCPAAAPNTSNSATDRPAARPNTSNSATDGPDAGPNTSNSATDGPDAAPNTSKQPRIALLPDLTALTQKRKRPAPNTGNSDASGRAAAPPNAGGWNASRRAAAARKSCNAHFLKQAAVVPNDRDSSNNNTNVSDPPNKGNTSSTRGPTQFEPAS